MKILVAELDSSYWRVSKEMDVAVLSVLRSGWYILGQSCKQFELSFAVF
jgi:hypothetical protein